MYTITAEAPGFKKAEASNNKLDPSATLSVDVTMTIGAATETVEVSATALALQTESAAVQRSVSRQQIDALELNGRNPIFMANLVPGTAAQPSPAQQQQPQRQAPAPPPVSADRVRSRMASFQQGVQRGRQEVRRQEEQSE